jgi:hypothetical protein
MRLLREEIAGIGDKAMPFDIRKYGPNWKKARARIQERAQNRCERCGVQNYAVGYRDESGAFIPTGGNEWHDKAGNGELSYKEARELVQYCNRDGGLGLNGERGIVIVCTTAHVHDCDPLNQSDDNLAFWCQACHNRHDAQMRANNRKANKSAKAGQRPLFEVTL